MTHRIWQNNCNLSEYIAFTNEGLKTHQLWQDEITLNEGLKTNQIWQDNQFKWVYSIC